MLRSLVIAAIAIGFLPAPEVAAEVATGCLTKTGRITKVALDDEPARPCGLRETEISLGLADTGTDDRIQTFAVVLAGGDDLELALGVRLSCQFLGGSSYRAVMVLSLPYVLSSDLDTLSVSSTDQIAKSSVSRYYPMIQSIDDTNLLSEEATAEIRGVTESVDLLTVNLEAAGSMEEPSAASGVVLKLTISRALTY